MSSWVTFGSAFIRARLIAAPVKLRLVEDFFNARQATIIPLKNYSP